MQGYLLDILILGLLVFLFGSIYRTRPSARLRYWIIGWLCVLAHFAILCFNPSSDRLAALLASLGLLALLLSAHRERREQNSRKRHHEKRCHSWFAHVMNL